MSQGRWTQTLFTISEGGREEEGPSSAAPDSSIYLHICANPPAPHVPTFWVFEGRVRRRQDSNVRAMCVFFTLNDIARTPHDTTKLVGLEHLHTKHADTLFSQWTAHIHHPRPAAAAAGHLGVTHPEPTPLTRPHGAIASPRRAIK